SSRPGARAPRHARRRSGGPLGLRGARRRQEAPGAPLLLLVHEPRHRPSPPGRPALHPLRRQPGALPDLLRLPRHRGAARQRDPTRLRRRDGRPGDLPRPPRPRPVRDRGAGPLHRARGQQRQALPAQPERSRALRPHHHPACQGHHREGDPLTMDITPKNITIRDLTEGFKDSGVGGVTSMNGTLDIRPAYQREFVYKDHQRDMVIDTVLKGRPLNVMYWAVRDDGTYEVMDGQQRTISICQYVDSAFSIDPDGSGNVRQFSNLTGDLRDRILDYELMVYICNGTDSEKLDWFRTINIAGEKLTAQELRNAVYTGPWLSSAKAWFSKT